MQEISELRGRTNLSQQNWVKERDELVSREAFVREEFETAKQAMQDWEVLAMEERAQREHLADRLAEVEEQLLSQKEAYERAASERDAQSQTVDSLQRALRDIQEGGCTAHVEIFSLLTVRSSSEEGTARVGRKFADATRGAPKATTKRGRSV